MVSSKSDLGNALCKRYDRLPKAKTESVLFGLRPCILNGRMGL
jgi:hypothetical protein